MHQAPPRASAAPLVSDAPKKDEPTPPVVLPEKGRTQVEEVKSPPPLDEVELAVLKHLPLGWRVFAFAGGVTFPDDVARAATDIPGDASPVAAATGLVAQLEAMESTNAGPGAAFRLGGEIIECSAVVQDGEGRRGHAAALRSSTTPSGVAHALYRAGGATVSGRAADELGKRLGLAQGALESPEARRLYPTDLARLVQAGTSKKMGSLFALYATPDAVAAAMTAEELPVAPPRLPVFALVLAADGRSGFAYSSGGEPGSLPGAPAPWDAPDQAPAVRGNTAALVFPGTGPCEHGPAQILDELRRTRSLSLATASLESKCAGVRYLVVSLEDASTNLEPETFLQLEGKPEGEPATEGVPAPHASAAEVAAAAEKSVSGSGRTDAPSSAVPPSMKKPAPASVPTTSSTAPAAPASVPLEKTVE